MAAEFGVLGEVRAFVDGHAVDVGHARQQCVLATLVVDANHPVPVDQLVARVYGEVPPQRARGTLQSYLSRLRQALGPGILVRRHHGYILTADPTAVDLHQFQRLADRGRAAADDATAAATLDRALTLWRGEPFGGLDAPWLNALREQLNIERLAVELDSNDARLRLGEHGALLGRLTAAAVRYPWGERLAGQLMLALYRCGRQAEALDRYRQVRRRLADELGADPSPPLRELHQRILTAAPDLAAPSVAPARRGPIDAIAADAAAATGAPVPRQLPASPTSFTGRVRELAELSAMLIDSPRGPATVVISAIGGAGGMGKTWLALRWAHDNRDHFPDGQLYVNLRGFDPTGEPVGASTAIRSFLEGLGVDTDRIPVDPDAQVALYRSLLADKRMLILLDNARDSATVDVLLPGTATSTVLVTSRHQLSGLVSAHGAHPLALDTLPERDAADLLRRRLGAARFAAEPDATAALLRHCAGLPLALGIIAARAVLRPDVPLAALAAELSDAGARLDAFDAGELTTNLRTVLDSSSAALTLAARQLFARLGLAPGPDISAAAAASLAVLPVADTRILLRQLASAHLIAEHAPGRYRMHDLVRLYAGELVAADAAQAVRRLFDHYLHTAHRCALLLSPHRDPLELPPTATGTVVPDVDDALLWLTTEYPVLIAVIRHAARTGYDRYVYQLAWTMATFYSRRGHWLDWVAVQHLAVDAAGRAGDLREQAEAHRLLANAYSNLRRYDEARTHLEHALQLFTRPEDEASRAHTYFDLALLADRHGRPREALPHAQRSLELYRRVGTPIKLAVALNAVGWYHAELGEHRAAIGYCEQALAISQQLGNVYGQANTWDSLGYAHHHLGQFDRAVDCYRAASDLFREMGDQDSGAIVLDHLGDTHAAAGHPAQARAAWQQALDAFDTLHHPQADSVRTKLDAVRVRP
jgi:DNA-binding SARP family transcriptional activator